MKFIKTQKFPQNGHPRLKEFSDKIEIDFFSTPYDLNMVDHLDGFIPAYKIGSGDLNWDKMLLKVSSKKKPVF